MDTFRIMLPKYMHLLYNVLDEIALTDPLYGRCTGIVNEVYKALIPYEELVKNFQNLEDQNDVINQNTLSNGESLKQHGDKDEESLLSASKNFDSTISATVLSEDYEKFLKLYESFKKLNLYKKEIGNVNEKEINERIPQYIKKIDKIETYNDDAIQHEKKELIKRAEEKIQNHDSCLNKPMKVVKNPTSDNLNLPTESDNVSKNFDLSAIPNKDNVENLNKIQMIDQVDPLIDDVMENDESTNDNIKVSDLIKIFEG